MKKEFFGGKKVLVMGLGRFGGGVDAAKFAWEAGAKVTVTDVAAADKLDASINQLAGFGDIEFHLGSHEKRDFEEADIIIVNPVVRPDSEFLEVGRQHNKLITSQINIFFELCPAMIIGITGSNGKSTTAALAAYLLKNARVEKVWLSGNIGNEALLGIIEQIKSDDLVVLEISSFQLEQLAQIKKGPQVALLTNLTPNHLDRHGTFENYCTAKENIFKFQKLNAKEPAVSIFNAEDKIGCEWFEKYKKDKGRVCIKFSVDYVSDAIKSCYPLPGRANLSNLAGAIAIGQYFGAEDEQIKSCLPEFKALPHRLELVAEINGVHWYNDSIATTPASAIAALEAFEQPKIIIAGGYDKNLPFNELGVAIDKKAKAAILIGQTAPNIAKAIRDAKFDKRGTIDEGRGMRIEIVKSLSEAVQLANKLAESGDVVLLSPGCASYDMFDNFEHRGKQFCSLVHQISR